MSPQMQKWLLKRPEDYLAGCPGHCPSYLLPATRASVLPSKPSSLLPTVEARTVYSENSAAMTAGAVEETYRALLRACMAQFPRVSAALRPVETHYDVALRILSARTARARTTRTKTAMTTARSACARIWLP